MIAHRLEQIVEEMNIADPRTGALTPVRSKLQHQHVLPTPPPAHHFADRPERKAGRPAK